MKVDETDSSYARAEVSQTKPSIGSRSGGVRGGHIVYFDKPKVVLLNIKEGYSAYLFQAGKYIKYQPVALRNITELSPYFQNAVRTTC